MTENVQNMFAVQKRETNAVAEAGIAREVQEVQAAMVIAKRFPRDPQAAMDRILNACTRPGLAESAVYSYARGGSAIEGPSIRLAECIAQEWGNLQFGIKEVDQRDGESTVEAFAWDVETNTRQVKTFQVKHKRFTRSGTKDLTDPRDVYEMVANQGARRLRACILGVIPGDVVDAAVKQCSVTMQSHEEITPDRIKAMLDAFEKYGIKKAQIEKRIQRRMDAITPALMANLRKIYNSLKDGVSSPGDWFDVVSEPDKPQKSESKLAKDLEKIDAKESDELPGMTNEAQ